MADDALGNHASMWVPATRYDLHTYTYLAGSDRMSMAVQPATPTDTTFYFPGNFGEAGEQLDVHDFNKIGSSTDQEKRDVINFYNGQQQLIRSHYTLDTAFNVSDPPPNYRSYNRVEYYRYDALGRRVFQRMVVDTGVICTHDDPASGCKDILTRTVWDGDQVLYDIRAPGSPTDPDQENDNFNATPFGKVRYIEGPGIDQPLELGTPDGTVLALTNWRGLYDVGACPSLCTGNLSSVALPEGQASSYGDHPVLSPGTWWGSIVSGSQDASGYQYRRNRYYDPTTGRFTQEDPAGLAGGLNAYGFGNGDPISYSDPFGLCTDPTDPTCIGAAQQAIANIRAAIGNLFNRLTGGLGTFRDHETGQRPGSTQDAVANVAMNPPDPGNVDGGVTLNVPLAFLDVSTKGIDAGFAPSDEFSITANLTYTVPNPPAGLESSFGFEGGDVVVGGVAVNTAGGRFEGARVSLGAGLGGKDGSAPKTSFKTLLDAFSTSLTLFQYPF